MLSIAPVSNAAGAASYYSADNYYVGGQLAEHSEWFGRGAAELELRGPVERAPFEAVLGGRLTTGDRIPDGTRGEHRPGWDYTFSAPKSLSILAYVGGDRRLLTAHLAAVRETMAWAEARIAHAREGDGGGRQRQVLTGKLVAALFVHDTSRLLDPQAHIHAVISNVTRIADGQWRALAERSLYDDKTTVASVYNSFLRQKVEALGY